MALSEHNQGLRDRSGSVDSKDPLVGFLYILMRDYLGSGTVEGLLQNHVLSPERETQFCNGYLANYAKDISGRLRANDMANLQDVPEAELRDALQSVYTRMAMALGPGIRRELEAKGIKAMATCAYTTGEPGVFAFFPQATFDDSMERRTPVVYRQPGEGTPGFLRRAKGELVAYIAADEAKPEMTIDTGDAHLDANGRDTRWTDMGDKPGGISTAHAALPRLRFLAEAVSNNSQKRGIVTYKVMLSTRGRVALVRRSPAGRSSDILSPERAENILISMLPSDTPKIGMLNPSTPTQSFRQLYATASALNALVGFAMFTVATLTPMDASYILWVSTRDLTAAKGIKGDYAKIAGVLNSYIPQRTV